MQCWPSAGGPTCWRGANQRLGRKMSPNPTMPGRGGHPSGVGRGSLPAVKDQVIVPRGDSESRCKERLDRFQLSEHGMGPRIFHSLFIGSRSIHGGQLQARLGGRLRGEWDGLQTGREGQETQNKITRDKWLSSLAHQNHWGVLKAPLLTSQRQKIVPKPGPHSGLIKSGILGGMT